MIFFFCLSQFTINSVRNIRFSSTCSNFGVTDGVSPRPLDQIFEHPAAEHQADGATRSPVYGRATNSCENCSTCNDSH